MATKRKSSSGRGGTLYGVLAGLLIGLVVAAVVAFYITKAPMPFVDRTRTQTPPATSSATPSPPPAPSLVLPDPNAGLYGINGAAGTAPTGPTVTPPMPLPKAEPPTAAAKPPQEQGDELGALIASLPSGRGSTDKTPASSAAPASKPPPAAKPQASGGTTYYLQVGAYRGEKEAEALRARVIMLGLPVVVQRAQVNGAQINRVRVGPFAKLDDMNSARGRLGENKIESAVVRQ